MKYYTNYNNSESCWSIDYWKDELLSSGIDKIILEEFVPDYGSGVLWCIKNGDCFEKGDGHCGKYSCKDYIPRNGKKGMCKHARVALTNSGNMFVLSENGLQKAPENFN